VSFGKQYLPFGDNIKMSNVMHYCRTIMKISQLPSSKPPTQLGQQPILRVEHAKEGDDKESGAVDEQVDECSDDIGLEDVDEYIRTAEEVELFQQLQDLHEHH
jgi:hypothetical protein